MPQRHCPAEGSKGNLILRTCNAIKTCGTSNPQTSFHAHSGHSWREQYTPSPGSLLCFSHKDRTVLTSWLSSLRASGGLGPGHERERELLQNAKLRVHSAGCISFSRMWVESAKDSSLPMKANVLSRSFWILRLGLPCTQKLEASFTFLVCPGK